MGISDKKMRHILSVARQCYEIAKNEYKLEEEECRKMFLVGFLHDIGYEFCENSEEHPYVGNEIIKSYFNRDVNSIKNHGKPNRIDTYDLESVILNKADMTVDSNGDVVGVEDRLLDIKNRYGIKSRQYKNSVEVAKKIGLIEV